MDWSRYHLPPDTIALLEQSPCVTVAGCVSELVEAACGGPGSDYYEVAYDVPGKGRVVEATVARVRNGVAVNYTDPYMRRRDPDSMGFMPQWIAREYLARRGSARFKPARCSLLGYTPSQLQVEGRPVANWFLQVETQPEVGEEAYDKGAAILRRFFLDCLEAFDTPDLTAPGRTIIECCRDGGDIHDYEKLIPA